MHQALDYLSPFLIGFPKTDNFVNVRMFIYAIFNLYPYDIFPAADYKVLESILYLNITVLVNYTSVSGVKPSILEGLFVFFWCLVIALYYIIAPHYDLAHGLPRDAKG